MGLKSKPISSIILFRSGSSLPALKSTRCVQTQRPSDGSSLYVFGTLHAMQGEKKLESESRDIQHEGTTVDSPKQLTGTMFFIVVLQPLELAIPLFLVSLVQEIGIEIESNFVEHAFSFRIQFASFEEYTLRADPSAQLWVFLVLPWHIAYNTGRATVGVLVALFKTKLNRSTAQKNSQ
jgi:hypothetical protein